MPYSRRGFLRHSALALLVAELAETQVLDARAPAALAADEGELLHVGPTRDPVRIKVSPTPQGRFAMITQTLAPTSVVPVHLHENEDEIIFIRSGTGRATVGDRQVELAAGSMLYVPQGTWHGGANDSGEPLEWVAIYSPSGFEGYFREIAHPPEGESPRRFSAQEIVELNRRYGIRYPD